MARAIFTEGVKNVAAGCNPMDLRRGAQTAVDAVVDFLKANSRVITTSEEIAQVIKELRGKRLFHFFGRVKREDKFFFEFRGIKTLLLLCLLYIGRYYLR